MPFLALRLRARKKREKTNPMNVYVLVEPDHILPDVGDDSEKSV